MATAPAADRFTLAARIGAGLYGVRPSARWIPSEECDVFALEFGATRPPKVLKLERAGSGVVAKEQRLLPFLRGHGLEVPVIEHAAAGGPGAAWPVAWSAMAFAPSRPLPELYAADPAAAHRVVARLGDFVARLVAVPLEAAPLGWPVAQSHAARLDWWDRRHATLLAHPARSARYERVFARARALLERPPACLGHGQGYQLLADGREAFAVIDWAGASASWPLLELAGATGALRTERGDVLTHELLPALLDGYTRRAGRLLTADERREMRVWEAYAPLLGAMYRHELGQPEKERALLAHTERVLDQASDLFG
jgi:aminoglycoside phosphotransferase (APT) family kinase protein